MRFLRSPCALGTRVAVLLALLLASCHHGVPGTELNDEPWRTSAAGRFGLTGDLGIANGHEVDSTLEVQDPNFPVDTVHLSGDLEGRFAGALGVEYFVVDDLSLNLGAERRIFEPDVSVDEFTFGVMQQSEYFLTARYQLPVRWLASGRLRPFVLTKLAYIPSVEFNLKTSFDLPDPLNDLTLTSPYRGGEYWSLAAGGGLAYQFSDSLVGRLGLMYEWALTESQATIPTSRDNSTGNPTIDEFLDGVFDELDFDVTLEPRGWVAYVGLVWFP